jgi:hypothetical protein
VYAARWFLSFLAVHFEKRRPGHSSTPLRNLLSAVVHREEVESGIVDDGRNAM